jgi:hypothetical protein
VMIVRQSSLSNAIQSLAVGGKSALDPATVIDVAKKYESFVLKNDPIQELVEMDNDLPD